MDLNSELDLQPRDMFANIGTTEQVLNQKICFQNIHNLSSVRIVYWVPLEKRHLAHGFLVILLIFS